MTEDLVERLLRSSFPPDMRHCAKLRSLTIDGPDARRRDFIFAETAMARRSRTRFARGWWIGPGILLGVVAYAALFRALYGLLAG